LPFLHSLQYRAEQLQRKRIAGGSRGRTSSAGGAGRAMKRRPRYRYDRPIGPQRVIVLRRLRYRQDSLTAATSAAPRARDEGVIAVAPVAALLHKALRDDPPCS
jgi:hypothetical protein